MDKLNFELKDFPPNPNFEEVSPTFTETDLLIFLTFKLKDACAVIERQSEMIAAHERYFEAMHELVLAIQEDIGSLLNIFQPKTRSE